MHCAKDRRERKMRCTKRKKISESRGWEDGRIVRSLEQRVRWWPDVGPGTGGDYIDGMGQSALVAPPAAASVAAASNSNNGAKGQRRAVVILALGPRASDLAPAGRPAGRPVCRVSISAL